MAALGRPEDERRRILERECGSDTELLAEVEDLLAAAGSPGPVDDLEAWLEPVHRRLGDETPPRTLGPYEVEREIGRGGMGIVYRARDPRLDRAVAVKVLYPHLASDDAMTERFVAEARAASGLDHPHVCTVHDLGRLDDGRFYIAMTLYPGGSLAHRLASGPLELGDALRITRQVAEGLHRTHEAGLVHRDVKPANIAFSEEGAAKVLDFGVAKLAASAATLPGAKVGTPRYMAPEQIRGEAVDRRADVWSLAAVAYEMLAGRPAFDADDPEAVRHQVLSAPPPDLGELRPDLPPAVSRAVAEGLSRRPGERPATTLELARRMADPAAARPPARGKARRLPSRPTRFLGRDQELEQLLDLLDRARLVTLTGPGGTGKTRLALEAAHRLAATGSEVWFVPLADLRDPQLVLPTVAEALGVEIGAGREPMEAVAATVDERRLHLVLDNLEHLPAAAPLLAELLERCPGVTLLTTSRGPLRLSAEHELPVPPLNTSTPAAAAEEEASAAARLFLNRARAAQPGFDPGRDELATVEEICRRLDGLPLALELAAARIRLFSPRQLLEQLDDRIDLPGRGLQDHAGRHRTLRQAIDWSHDLLSVPHRRLLRTLSVFRGGFTLETAAAVAETGEAELADGIDALLDQSLILRSPAAPGPPRFQLLETLRTYAANRLREAGEEAAVRRRHRRVFLDLAERAAPQIEAGDQRRWIGRLTREHDNLRAALEEGPEETPADREERLRLAAALWRFWIARGHFREGLERLETLLAACPEADRDARFPALVGAATLAHNVVRHRRARELLSEAGELCRRREDLTGLLQVVNNQAWVALEATDLEEAEELAEEGLALARRLDDRRAEAVALNNLGFLAAYRSHWDAAAEHHRASLELRRDIGDRRGEGFALINLSWAEREGGDLEAAQRHLDRADRVIAALDDRLFTLWSTCHRVALALARGEADRAEISEEMLQQAREVGNLSVVAELLYWRAATAAARDEPRRAARLARESLDLCDGYGWRWGEVRCCEQLGAAATRLGDDDDARRWWRRAATVAEDAGLTPRAERARREMERWEADDGAPRSG